MAQKIVFFTKDDDAYAIAQEHIEGLTREEEDFKTRGLTLEDKTKGKLEQAQTKGYERVIVECNTEHETCVSCVGLYDGENEHLMRASGDTLRQARRKAFSLVSEYLEKTPLSYHSHFHGGVAQSKESDSS